MGRLEKKNKNTEALVTFKNVSKSFGATKALIDCNIEFKKGEIHSLVGENGAGKSTFINILFFYPILFLAPKPKSSNNILAPISSIF